VTTRWPWLGILLFWLAIAVAGRAGDWPQFRGPGGTGMSDDKNLPVKWDTKDGVRWKAELPGRGVSSPVVADGRVYVTACTGYRNARLHVLCFDAATGKKRWERQFAATGSTTCNPMTCMAAPTPATDGKNVYALFASADLAALNADGDLLWYRSLAAERPNITNQVGMAASLVRHKDLLIVPLENAGDSFVAAVETKTGKDRWKIERPRDITWATPLLAPCGPKGRVDLLLQSPTILSAVDPESGKPRWSYKGEWRESIPSPSTGDGLLFVPGKPLLALKLADDDQTPEFVWKSPPTFASRFASPVLYKGRLYGVVQTGIICLDAKTGTEVWRERADGPFSASPLIADGKLYVVNEKGTAFVFSLGEKPELLSKNVLDDTILATPALANGAIYVRSDSSLYCIGAKK
jgi:outer membrane protein assembly factor BamB